MEQVSIALCTYNGEQFLPEQLESYLWQTRQPDELVVCDDGSTDSTLDILKAFKSTAPFPVGIFLNETNLGVIKNFDRVIGLCSGDIIFLSDQDDVWKQEKIRKTAAALEKFPQAALAFCDVEFVWPDLSSYDRTLFEILGYSSEIQRDFLMGKDFASLLSLNCAIGCAMAFRASYKELISPIPTDIPNVLHDVWIGLVLSGGALAVPLPTTLVKYRQHSEQLTGYACLLDTPKATPETEASSTIRGRLLATRLHLEELVERASRIQDYISQRTGSESVKIDRALSFLRSHISHLSCRIGLHGTRSIFERVVPIARELASLRYRRYSSGFRSVLRDLVLIKR